MDRRVFFSGHRGGGVGRLTGWAASGATAEPVLGDAGALASRREPCLK